MEYRTLGNTGLTVSEIGFGCGNTGGLMVSGSPQERAAVVARALELGITYFDTASTYGDGLSENHLGETLRELGAHALGARTVVATKARVMTEELGDISGAVVRSVEASLGRLGMESVDLVQLHSRMVTHRAPGARLGIGPPLTVEEVLGPGGVVEAFERLREQGKVRHFGLCAFGGEMAALRRGLDSGRLDTLLVYYNMLNPSAGMPAPPGFQEPDYERIIDHAGAGGLGVVVVRVLAAGALSGAAERHPLAGGGGGPEGTGRGYEADAERTRSLAFLNREGRHSQAQAAIRFALMKREVSTVLVGFSSLAQVEEAAACSGAGGLDPADLERLDGLRRAGFGSGSPD